MPDPNPASVSDADILDFSDAPGGDVPFDQLFGSEPTVAQPTTAQPDTTPAPVTSQPATPAANDFYLDAGTSKYKTREEAIRGFTHKDEVIEHLRGIAVQATGIDPLTGQKVAVPHPQSSVQSPYAPGQPATNDSYLNNPAKYSADLRNAVARNDEGAYLQVQTRLAREQMMQDLAPMVPMFQKFAVRTAVEAASEKTPEFKGFYGTPDYQKALDARPILKSAIQNAEGNFEYQGQLPELYSLAYEIAQLQKMSELVRAQQQPSTPVQTRPTTTPSKLTPPAPGTVNTANWRSNQTSAQALVDEYERKMGF